MYILGIKKVFDIHDRELTPIEVYNLYIERYGPACFRTLRHNIDRLVKEGLIRELEIRKSTKIPFGKEIVEIRQKVFKKVR